MDDRPLVLVVDDEPFVPRVVDLKLSRAGYRVISAPNGRLGLELIASEHPRVVVTDISMPEMSGYELCHAAQEYRQENPFLIVVVTSRAERDMLQWVQDIPELVFFEKPLSPRNLLRVVDAYIATGAVPTMAVEVGQ